VTEVGNPVSELLEAGGMASSDVLQRRECRDGIVMELRQLRLDELQYTELWWEDYPDDSDDWQKVYSIADAIRSGVVISPIDVSQEVYGKHRILDGHHRARAHEIAGKDYIWAWVTLTGPDGKELLCDGREWYPTIKPIQNTEPWKRFR